MLGLKNNNQKEKKSQWWSQQNRQKKKISKIDNETIEIAQATQQRINQIFKKSTESHRYMSL